MSYFIVHKVNQVVDSFLRSLLHAFCKIVKEPARLPNGARQNPPATRSLDIPAPDADSPLTNTELEHTLSLNANEFFLLQ